MKDHKKEMTINYDNDHDVLYVSIGQPKPSYCDRDLDGILIRKSYETNRFSGVTILDFSKRTIHQIAKVVPKSINLEKIYASLD